MYVSVYSSVLSEYYIFVSVYCSVVTEYLRKDPFTEFLESFYFKRYLQWKFLEQ
jgi:hypothetical protein